MRWLQLSLVLASSACRPAQPNAVAVVPAEPEVAPAPAHMLSATTASRHPGCFLLEDVDTHERVVVGGDECAVATIPCSTFKIPHAIIALETGVLADASHVERWDGTEQPIDAWERDHDLGSAIHHSVVWYFRRTAAAIGPDRMRAELERMHYGNADVCNAGGTCDPTSFWLVPGSLSVTGFEQLDFMRKLVARELPQKVEHQDLVLELMRIVPDDLKGRVPADVRLPATTATLQAKTGSGELEDHSVTWWMGLLERDGHRFIFVSRVRQKAADWPRSPAVLHGVGALVEHGVW